MNWINNKNDEIAFWKNEYAKEKGLYMVSQNLYETVAQERDKIFIENTKLKGRLDSTDREVQYYASMSLKYKKQLDSVSTQPVQVDSNYFEDTQLDTTDRIFDYRDDELTLQGYFQTVEPWQLFVKNIELIVSLDISLSQDKNNQWFYNIDTKSEYLKPEAVNITIVPYPTKWEMFIGGDIVTRGVNPVGVGIHGGLKKGDYGGFIGMQGIEDLGLYFRLGITKYWSL